MTDPRSTGEPDDLLLLFAPVATTCRGANGWSSEVQRASVGRSPSSAYQLRRCAGADSPFSRAWDEAATLATDQALDQAMAGGMVARRTEVYYCARMAGWRARHDDRLAFAALRALDKREARLAARGGDVTMLPVEATALLDRRERCEAPATGDVT